MIRATPQITFPLNHLSVAKSIFFPLSPLSLYQSLESRRVAGARLARSRQSARLARSCPGDPNAVAGTARALGLRRPRRCSCIHCVSCTDPNQTHGKQAKAGGGFLLCKVASRRVILDTHSWWLVHLGGQQGNHPPAPGLARTSACSVAVSAVSSSTTGSRLPAYK